jgi:hypothetical protein
MSASIVTQAATEARNSVVVALVLLAIVLALFPVENYLTRKTHEESASCLTQAAATAGRILLLDEQMSRSTMMAIESGDPVWTARYQTFSSTNGRGYH